MTVFTFSQMSLNVWGLNKRHLLCSVSEFVVLVEVDEDIRPHTDDIVGKGIFFFFLVAFSVNCEFICDIAVKLDKW